MIAAVITNAGVVSAIYSAGVVSSLVLGCHWCRGLASRMERGGKA